MREEKKDVSGRGLMSRKRKFADDDMEAERLRIRKNILMTIFALIFSILSLVITFIRTS